PPHRSEEAGYVPWIETAPCQEGCLASSDSPRREHHDPHRCDPLHEGHRQRLASKHSCAGYLPALRFQTSESTGHEFGHVTLGVTEGLRYLFLAASVEDLHRQHDPLFGRQLLNRARCLAR